MLDLALSIEAMAGIGLSNPLASYALALDFKNGAYWSGGTQAASLSAMPGYSYTRTGAVSYVNNAGGVSDFAADAPPILSGIGYEAYGALTNLLLNAGSNSTLSTQSVTVSAVAYTLAFIGTGTVTLSGTSTAGPLVGSGATTQVALNFTPTAGSLTLTVSGDVRYAVLVAGTFAAQSVPIIATTTAAASIGEGALSVSDGPADVEQLFIARAKVLNNINGRFARWDVAGSDTNRIELFQDGNTISAYMSVNGVAGSLGNVASTANTDVVAVIRRDPVAGTWRVGVVSGGSVTWAAAVTAGFPIGLDKVHAGRYPPGAGFAPNGPIKFVGRREGSFGTDAEVLAAVNPAL